MVASANTMQLFVPLVAFFVTTVSAQSAKSLLRNPLDFFGGNETVNDNNAYLSWVEIRASTYTSALFLPSTTDPAAGAAMHWTITGDSIFLAVVARAEGWLGFGVSENGGMQGADVVLFTAENPDKLVDAHILEELNPVPDNCQNWEFVSSQAVGGFLIFEATRLLDTGDPQDSVIMNDANRAMPATRIIAAWGDSSQIGYHGSNRARGALRWFSDTDEANIFAENMEANSEGFFDLRASDYAVPEIDTDYAVFCASREEIIAQGVPDVDYISIIGFEPIISAGSEPYVHHFTVYGSSLPNNGLSTSHCRDLSETSVELAYVWAPGEGPFVLPDNLGTPFAVDRLQSFVMETHYDNPSLVQGILDSSGVRFYYTTQRREIEVGVLQLGDPYVALYGELVGSGISSHSFECGGNCSAKTLDQPVTILREYLHMHKTGVRMVNEQIRGGQVVRSGVIDFFDFHQQGNQPVQQEPFEVLPGDAFNTVCYYKSDDARFGVSSQEEMCIAFVYYYPRQVITQDKPWICAFGQGNDECDPQHTQRTLSSDAELERIFGQPTNSAECGGAGATTIATIGATTGAITIATSGATTTIAETSNAGGKVTLNVAYVVLTVVLGILLVLA